MQYASSEFKKNLSGNKVTGNIYERRTKILKSISMFHYFVNIRQLNVAIYCHTWQYSVGLYSTWNVATYCNVAHLAEYLFSDYPSIIINKNCTRCLSANIRNIYVVNINFDILLRHFFCVLLSNLSCYYLVWQSPY